MKPRAVATELVVAIAARAAPSYGRSTLTPAVSDVNVLTQEWPELAACRRFVTSLEWRLFVARPRNRPYEWVNESGIPSDPIAASADQR